MREQYFLKYRGLKRENKQLKEEIKDLNDVLASREELFIRERNVKNNWRDLKEENEQLKQELKIYRKIANCHNCDYHYYDWYDDYDEFEVCEKGNDVANGICEYWKEL